MTTTRYPLTKSAWVDCGTTPCLIQSVSSSPVLFVVDTAAPSSLEAAAHQLYEGGEVFADISTASQRVFARSSAAAGALIVSR